MFVSRISDALNIATCLVVLASLWIRRRTFKYKWEQPNTIGLALIAVGVTLKAPPINWLIDADVLHGLHLLIAHIFILSGIASLAYGAEQKCRSDQDIRRWHIRFIVFPWHIGVAVMVGLFAAGARTSLDERFQFPEGYTMAYWLTYDIVTIYFFGLCAYALWYLIWDPPSRVAAGIYLTAVCLGLVTAGCRVLLTTVEDDIPNTWLIVIANIASATAISLFAIGSAYMWKRRLWAAKYECGNTYQQNVIKNTEIKSDKDPHCA